MGAFMYTNGGGEWVHSYTRTAVGNGCIHIQERRWGMGAFIYMNGGGEWVH